MELRAYISKQKLAYICDHVVLQNGIEYFIFEKISIFWQCF